MLQMGHWHHESVKFCGHTSHTKTIFSSNAVGAHLYWQCSDSIRGFNVQDKVRITRWNLSVVRVELSGKAAGDEVPTMIRARWFPLSGNDQTKVITTITDDS
jgi:hypothetical protein